jgi:hypothetical protein
MSKRCEIEDWAGNKTYPGLTFGSVTEAWDFLMEDQHKRHPNATEKEFDDIMGEFYTEEVDAPDPIPLCTRHSRCPSNCMYRTIK